MNALWRSLPIIAITVGLSGAYSTTAVAEDFKTAQAVEDLRDLPEDTVTWVSELADVQPTDWAFQALQSLVENYGCIAAYPDGTYRGNRAINRFEFAASLNSCLRRINQLIAGNRKDKVTREDFLAIQRLMEEFSAEFTVLRADIDVLEARTAELEVNVFSPTTQLVGGVEFALIAPFGDSQAVSFGQSPNEDLALNPTLGGRAILGLKTSFTGRDLLRTTLEAGNFVGLSGDLTGTNTIGYDFATNTDNKFNISMFYRFPLGNRGLFYVSPKGISAATVAPTLNPVPSLSSFGARNPVYRLSDGAGVGATYQFSNSLSGSVSYLVASDSAPNPTAGNGLFNGQYGAFAQLTFTPSPTFAAAINYVRYYSPGKDRGVNLSGGTGSIFANGPFETIPTSADAFGLQASYRFSDRFSMGAWVGYVNATAESSGSSNGIDVSQGDRAEVWNWAVTFAFPDVGKPGSQLGLIFGMPPKLVSNDVSDREDKDTSYHIEALYRYPVTDDIFLIPGIILILNPEHNAANDSLWLGILRTTFVF